MRKILNVKSASVAALLCASTLFLTGFDKEASPGELLNSISENMNAMKSFTGNMAMELEMTGEISEGQKGTITMGIDIDMETTKEPEAAYIDGNIAFSMLGTNMSIDMENYTVAEGDEYVSYTLTNGVWSKDISENTSTGAQIETFTDLSDGADAFVVSKEPVKINDKDCYELIGEFEADDMFGVLDSAGDAADGIEDMMDGVDMGNAMVPVKICIYADTLMPALMEIDFTNAMQEALVSSAADQEVMFDNFLFSLSFDSFNDVDGIAVPEEAIKAVQRQAQSEEAANQAANEAINQAANEAANETDSMPEETTEKLSTIETEAALPASGTGWQTYEVLFNGTTITLPCEIAEMEALGYTLDTDTDTEYVINKEDYQYGYLKDNSDALISVDFLNMTTGPLTIPECKIGSIGTDKWFMEGSKNSIVYPEGITLGSTKDEVLSAYGNPQEAFEGDSVTSMYYYNSESYKNGMDITIDNESGTVSSLTIRKFE